MVTVHRCYGMMKVYKIRKENGMEQTIKFTKKNTLAVKGIAISFLLCYHCFSQTARMGGAEVSFWPLPQNLAMLISLCMVQCVGMFAFLSVYGLTLSMKSKYPEYDFDGHTATLFVLKRYVKLVLTFLVPFVFCVGVTFVTDTSRYPAGMFANIISIIMDFFGVGHMFGGRMLVSSASNLQKIQLAYCDAVPSSRQFPDRKACTSDKISFYRTACDMFC